MNFSKIEMQKELFNFLNQFGRDIENLYGIRDGKLTTEGQIQNSPIWRAVDAMYDYGIMGIPCQDLYPGARFCDIYSYTETFLRSVTSQTMKIFLDESNKNTPPHLSFLAAQTAVARIMLDGGDRHADYEQNEYGLRHGNFSHLTLAEVSLLANMDERSVRNAANPKLADPLKTEQFGKRSLVSPEEARRWLVGRKGFIPTQPYNGPLEPRPPELDIVFSTKAAEILIRDLQKEGGTLENYLNKLCEQDGLKKGELSEKLAEIGVRAAKEGISFSDFFNNLIIKTSKVINK